MVVWSGTGRWNQRPSLILIRLQKTSDNGGSNQKHRPKQRLSHVPSTFTPSKTNPGIALGNPCNETGHAESRSSTSQRSPVVHGELSLKSNQGKPSGLPIGSLSPSQSFLERGRRSIHSRQRDSLPGTRIRKSGIADRGSTGPQPSTVSNSIWDHRL